MSCLDNASPTWGPSFANQIGTQPFANIFTEAYLDSLPGLLFDQGYSCEQAKAEILAFLGQLSPQGSFGIAKNGAVVQGAQGAFVSPTPWEVSVVNDNTTIATTSFPPMVDPWPESISGIDFSLAKTFVVSGGDGSTVRVPVDLMLLAFDFDVWWACASGCVAPPPQRPTPRLGMQTLSNFTYSVINSFGQVPRI